MRTRRTAERASRCDFARPALPWLQLVRNVAALYGVRLVDQLLPILVIPFLARVLGAEGWGLVAAAQALAVYGIVTVEYGFELAGPARSRKVATIPGASAS